jgi:hypothetical protein
MHVLGRPGTARGAGRPFAAIGAVTVVVAGMAGIAAFTLPAAATTHQPAPTYHVRVLLSGKNLHHRYTKAGSPEQHAEPLAAPGGITYLDGHLFTAFQNGVGPHGQASRDGNRDSTIVEFTLSGAVVKQWDIRGKNAGLTANRRTGLLVATVNEDANSSLYTIRPATGVLTHYAYAKPLPHRGGTGAISFDNGLMLISASAPGTSGAPARDPGYPAVYLVTLNKARHLAYFGALFHDGSRATAVNGPHSGHPVTLARTDPDSSEVVPGIEARFAGDFLVTSPGDKEQVYVSAPRTRHQHLWVLGLSQPVEATAWSTSWHGSFYATSTGGDTVDVISGSFWPGTAFVSVTPCQAGHAPAACPGPGSPASWLGQLDMSTGHIARVSLSGAALHPQGVIFVASGAVPAVQRGRAPGVASPRA